MRGENMRQKLILCRISPLIISQPKVFKMHFIGFLQISDKKVEIIHPSYLV